MRLKKTSYGKETVEGKAGGEEERGKKLENKLRGDSDGQEGRTPEGVYLAVVA